MTTRSDITAIQSNDELYHLALTYDGTPLNLNGYTVSAVIKASPGDPDSTGTAYTPAVTDAAAGTADWTVPRADTTAPGLSWYRVDVTDGTGGVVTAVMGGLTITAS